MSSPDRLGGQDRGRGRLPIGYLGWDGHGNLGDDAIRDALAQALPHLRLVPLPLNVRGLTRFLSHPRVNRVRRMNLLLGGGTVIGRKNWRVPLTVDLALCGQKPAFMVGVGVEDPRFQGRHSFSKDNELARWSGVLRSFDKVTVRGPRSAELLADIGVDSRVVGDPALLFEPPTMPGVTDEEDLIGVNLGFGSDLWSHDQRRVVAQVAQAAHALSHRHGFRLRFLVVNEEDRRWISQCVDQAGLSAGGYDVCTTLSCDQYFSAIGSCAVVLAERLHAGVLAAASGIPTVMLEYQPKCHDFMESIDQASWSMRTDNLDHPVLVERLLCLVQARESERTRLLRAVGTLRKRLNEEVARLVSLTAIG